jgi:hypothetical protein
LGNYLAPRSFVVRCMRDVLLEMAAGATRAVDARTTALAEMLRVGIAQHEFNTVSAAADGLGQMVNMYCGLSDAIPEVRRIETPEGPVDGWLGFELSAAFVAAGEAVLAGASQAEYQRVVDLIDSSSFAFVRSELIEEADQMIQANIALGTSPHQVRPETVNTWPQAATTLAMIEREAEERPTMADIARRALSGWALAVAYPEIQFGYEHPGRSFSLGALGANPPWNDALALIRSDDWRRRWANKIGAQFPAVEAALARAREELEA